MPEAVQALTDALHCSFSSVGHELICVFVIGNIEILFLLLFLFLFFFLNLLFNNLLPGRNP